MAISLDDVRPTRASTPWPLIQGLGMAGLLLAELLTMTIRFDARLLGGNTELVARLLVAMHWVPQLLIAVAAALAVFWGARLRVEFERLCGGDAPRRRTWPYLVGHLAAFAAFLPLTSMIWERDLRTSPAAVWWAAAWLVDALAIAVLWIAAALPVPLWKPQVGRIVGIALAGLATGVAACAVGEFTKYRWDSMAYSTLRFVYFLLGLVFRDTVCQPDQFLVGTSTFTVKIVSTCAGFEGIGLIWVFLAVYLVIDRRRLRFPQALVLLPLGTVIMWLANAARIAALVTVGTLGSRSVAREGFHSQAGWLAFNLVGLGLVAVASRWRWLAAPCADADSDGAAAAARSIPTTAYLAPLFTILTVGMVTGAFSSGFDTLYPLRVLAAVLVLGAFWHGRIARPSAWVGSWEAVAIGVGVFALWMALEPATSGPASETALARGLAGLSRGTAIAWVAFRVIGSVITVPIAEELAFRGCLIRRLIKADFEKVAPGTFSWTSFLVSSALFGLMHDRWLAGTLAGMLYALALYRRGKLADAVLAHATTNALIAGNVLATGNWFLWS